MATHYDDECHQSKSVQRKVVVMLLVPESF